MFIVLFQTGHEQIVPGERRHRTLHQLVRGGEGSRRSQAARRHGVQTLGIINFPNMQFKDVQTLGIINFPT